MLLMWSLESCDKLSHISFSGKSFNIQCLTKCLLIVELIEFSCQQLTLPTKCCPKCVLQGTVLHKTTGRTRFCSPYSLLTSLPGFSSLSSVFSWPDSTYWIWILNWYFKTCNLDHLGCLVPSPQISNVKSILFCPCRVMKMLHKNHMFYQYLIGWLV